MTVSSSTDRTTFLGNGVTQIFPLPFRFFDNSDIQASLVTNATGALTPLTIGTHYTLSGASDPEVDGSPASELTMLAAPSSLQSLFVQRVIPVTQPTDILNQSRFFPEIHENVFDRLTMLLQQVAGESKGAIRVAVGDPEPARLPNAISRALQLMGFDSNGDPIAVAPASGSVAEFALALADINSALLVGGSAASDIGLAARDFIANTASRTLASFGVVADDDSAPVQAANVIALQDAFNWAVGGRKLIHASGRVYFNATITAPALSFITLEGSGHWLGTPDDTTGARLTFTGTGFGIVAHTLTLLNLVYDGEPDLVTGVYTAGRSGIQTTGNFQTYNCSFLGFDRWWSRVGASGYYHKFYGGSIQWCNRVFEIADAYNTTFFGVSIYEINSLGTWSGGNGPIMFIGGSIEAWTETALQRASGAENNLLVFDGVYIENYPTTAVRVGLTGTTYDNAIFLSATANHVRFTNCSIHMAGVRRIVSATSIKSLHMQGNVYFGTASPAGTAPDGVISLSGTNSDTQFNDSYNNTAGQTVPYIFGLTLGSFPVETSTGLQGLYREPTTGETRNLRRIVTATLLNAWAAPGASYESIQYAKTIDGAVKLQGAASGGAATGAVVMTLPVGFRPSVSRAFPVSSATTDATRVCRVLNTGDVRIEGVAPYPADLSFDSVEFKL